MNRGIRNNNPFNIRYVKTNLWKGKVKDDLKNDMEFEEFRTIAYGVRAGYLLLSNYIHSGTDVLKDLISRFAPPSENDTESYIRNVCNNEKWQSDLELVYDERLCVGSVHFIELGRRMMFIESGYLVPFNSLFNLIESFNLFR